MIEHLHAAVATVEHEQAISRDDAGDGVVQVVALVSELTELALDVMKWSYQKFAVALGVDAEIKPGELTDLIFDADGNWVRPT